MKGGRLLQWFLFCLLLLLAGLTFLLATENGFRLLLRACDSLAGPAFSVARVEGRFVDSWRLERVQIHVDGVVDLELDELRCSWRPGALAGQELQIDHLVLRGLVLRLPAAAAEKGDGATVVLPALRFSLGLRVGDAQLDDIEVYFSDAGAPLVVNAVRIKASVHDDQLSIDHLQLDSPDYGGKLQATVQFRDHWPLVASGEWRVTDPGIGDLSGSVAVEGDLAQLAVSVALQTPAVARIRGQLTDILNDLHWQATGETDYFRLTDIRVDLPIDGRLSVVEASGTWATYAGTLEADIHYQGYPQVGVHAEVHGGYNGLTIGDLRLVQDEARIVSTGEIGWMDGFTWRAELDAEQLDPGRWLSGWPGKIGGLLQTEGTWAADGLKADLKIESLQGELRGFPLVGSGEIGLDGKSFRVDALQLQSGTSYLRADGHGNSELALTFQAGSDDLASLVPESSGVFQLQGTVNGSRKQPRLAMTFNGSEINLDGFSLQSLQAVVAGDLTGAGNIGADVLADGVEVRGERISRARLQLQGNLERHRVDLSIDSRPGTIQLALSGGLHERRWQGELADLLLQTRQFGAWRTEKAVPLRLAEKKCDLAEFSLVQDHVRISLAGQWQQEEGWQIHAGLANFSLGLLEEWGLVTTRLEGELSATLMAAGQRVIPDRADLVISGPDFSLTTEGEQGESRSFHWTGNDLQVKLEDRELRLLAHTLFQDGSVAELEVAVANCCDLRRQDEMPLHGRLEVEVKDLGQLAPLSGYMVQGRGRLAGRVALQGTVASPILQGRVTLADGEIKIPAAGIALQELELSVAGDPTANRVALTLGSEGGRLKAEGMIRQSPQQQWQADFTVKGEDFQLLDLAEYQAVVSPDLHVVYGETGTALSGTVTVARARIAPLGLQGTVSSSRDVIIVDADGQRRKSGLPLSLDLELVLGEEVEVDAFGVRGYLDGRLQVQQEPGQVMTGLGSLNLRAGTFVFKGVNLQINRGLLFYQGGAIDDPGLDVRAGKEVVDHKEVGVRLTGSVTRMEMKLFSNPPMDESDILAYLLVGHDMSGTSEREGSLLGAAAAGMGIGTGGALLRDLSEETGFDLSLAGGERAADISLVVGREIGKDFYISYGKGLTDSAGTFKARYILKYGFSVETETTSEATGTDLLWSFEH